MKVFLFLTSLIILEMASASELRILETTQDMSNPSSGCLKRDPYSRLRCLECNSTHFRIRGTDNDQCVWCNASAWSEGCISCDSSLNCTECNLDTHRLNTKI